MVGGSYVELNLGEGYDVNIFFWWKMSDSYGDLLDLCVVLSEQYLTSRRHNLTSRHHYVANRNYVDLSDISMKTSRLL